MKSLKKSNKRREKKGKVRPVITKSPPEVSTLDIVRDQNNCKSYHKIVRNYLISNGLGSLL